MGKPHALVIPFPVQGHVIPLMTLSHSLVQHGFEITFVCTEFTYKQILSSQPKEVSSNQSQIRLISMPDGMEPGEDRNHLGKLCESITSTMPAYLEELIRKMNRSFPDDSNNKITCVIADENMGWAVRVAKKMGIPQVSFWPAAAGLRALLLHIPQLIEDGVIDAKGAPKNHQMIKLSPSMPAMNTAHFGWHCIGDLPTQQALFHYLYTNTQAAKEADWLLSNSFYDIEPSAFKLTPKLLPIGPLLGTNLSGEITGNFWSEDSSCVEWLDKQAPCSVIYIAFGSITVFNQHQFHELAIGIELIGQPFLWVVKPDLTDSSAATYPDGFQERIATRGKIVSWAPQQKVLAHPSVSLFITHCGWNSTMEGLSMGVPFLCWPYFADQFLNQSYISDIWKVGLQLNVGDDGIISSAEIYKKFKDLIGDETIRTRALEMKEKTNRNLTTEGSSLKNFNDFLQAMKGR